MSQYPTCNFIDVELLKIYNKMTIKNMRKTMKKIFFILLLFFLTIQMGCSSLIEQTQFNDTMADMKATDFFNVTKSGKFIAIKGTLLPPKQINKKTDQEIKSLALAWFKKFISINNFKETYIDNENKELHGSGMFPLLSSVDTFLIFDFYVFYDGIIGLKIQNWKVYGPKTTYQPNAWVRDYERDYRGNYKSSWPVIKSNFQDYFLSFQYEVVNKI